MKVFRTTLFACLLSTLLFCGGIASASEYEGVKVTPVKKSTTAYNGQELAYPKTDSPEVTAVVVEVPPGGETGWHYHTCPVYAYMLDGEISIEVEGGRTYTFGAGDAIFEVVNVSHNGRNTGTVPARLVVFYTGREGSPTTVKGHPH
jgi:quercetin dioxygenase-like cupin family protein